MLNAPKTTLKHRKIDKFDASILTFARNLIGKSDLRIYLNGSFKLLKNYFDTILFRKKITLFKIV